MIPEPIHIPVDRFRVDIIHRNNHRLTGRRGKMPEKKTDDLVGIGGIRKIILRDISAVSSARTAGGNVLLTPHIAGGTVETRKRMFLEIASQVAKLAKNEEALFHAST